MWCIFGQSVLSRSGLGPQERPKCRHHKQAAGRCTETIKNARIQKLGDNTGEYTRDYVSRGNTREHRLPGKLRQSPKKPGHDAQEHNHNSTHSARHKSILWQKEGKRDETINTQTNQLNETQVAQEKKAGKRQRQEVKTTRETQGK